MTHNTMQDTIRLLNEDNTLCIMLEGEPTPLVFFHPSGEVDTIKANRPDFEKLAAALYDEREQGNILSTCNAARLPSGSIIRF